jgi:ABC-type antimicrobial peptide transport system permease subunit
VLALVGVVLGLAGAFAVTRVLASALYAVRPTDPLTFRAVSLLMMALVVVASYIPTRRATEIDPIVALRYE